ncbi:MAG: peptidylprolyl isomerase, partial [bacterium]|nr:peptidylprolyl isomerase [bacterium]
DAPGLCIDPAAAYTAVFDTTRGTVRVALAAANVPGTVNSFVNLARFGYYDRTLIHRSDPSIGILQGGAPHTNSVTDPGPGYTLWDEGSGFDYRPGQLVMARRESPNSADAQFFFTVTDAAALLDADGTSVVFGEITAGLDVLTGILAAHRDEPGNDFGGAPDPPVLIRSVTIETRDGEPPEGTGETGGEPPDGGETDPEPPATAPSADAGPPGGTGATGAEPPATAVDADAGPPGGTGATGAEPPATAVDAGTGPPGGTGATGAKAPGGTGDEEAN